MGIVEEFSHDPAIREAAHSDRPDHPDVRSSHHGRVRFLGAVARAGEPRPFGHRSLLLRLQPREGGSGLNPAPGHLSL